MKLLILLALCITARAAPQYSSNAQAATVITPEGYVADAPEVALEKARHLEYHARALGYTPSLVAASPVVTAAVVTAPVVTAPVVTDPVVTAPLYTRAVATPTYVTHVLRAHTITVPLAHYIQYVRK